MTKFIIFICLTIKKFDRFIYVPVVKNDNFKYRLLNYFTNKCVFFFYQLEIINNKNYSLANMKNTPYESKPTYDGHSSIKND